MEAKKLSLKMTKRHLYVNGKRARLIAHPSWQRCQGFFTGVTRAIYRHEDIVIKLDVNTEICSQGETEIGIYAHAISLGEEKIFAEIIDAGYVDLHGRDILWVAQKYLNMEKPKSNEYPLEVRLSVEKYGVKDVWEGRNWGYVNGRPVVYDYGI